MLGESPEQIEAAERRRERARLLHLAFPASLIRFRLDVAQRQLDRLLDGPEPPPSKWNVWRELQRFAWWSWRCFNLLQAQRRSMTAEGDFTSAVNVDSGEKLDVENFTNQGHMEAAP